MRYSALIIGLLGGLLALIGTSLTLTSAGVGGIFRVTGSGQAFLLSMLGLVFAVLGIIGAIDSLSRPTRAGILMIIAAIGGTVAITGAFLFGGILLFIAAIFAFEARREEVHRVAPVRA